MRSGSLVESSESEYTSSSDESGARPLMGKLRKNEAIDMCVAICNVVLVDVVLNVAGP